MRIAIVSQGFGYGGSYIAAANIGKALQATGHEMYYFAYQYKTNYSNLPIERLTYFGHPRTKISRLFEKSRKAIELFIQGEFIPSHFISTEFKNLIHLINTKQIDLVILNSFWTVTLFSVLLRQKFPELKIVGWMHEATDYTFGNLTQNYRDSFIKGVRDLSALVCLTDKDRKKYLHYNNKSYKIYNPLVISKHELADLSQHTIVFTTRLDAHIKGLDYLIEIAKNLPSGWHINVAGQGKREQVIAFQNLISKSEVEQKIHFLGELTGNDLSDHYERGSIFLSTSRTEGLPLVIIEAMSFGLPVVSFAHSGGCEILAGGRYGKIVPIGDVDAMISAIKVLAESKELRLHFQELSLQRYENFKLGIITKEWENLLSAL